MDPNTNTNNEPGLEVETAVANETVAQQQPAAKPNGAVAAQAAAPAIQRPGIMAVVSEVGNTPIRLKHVGYTALGLAVGAVTLQVVHRWVPGCPAPLGHVWEKAPIPLPGKVK